MAKKAAVKKEAPKKAELKKEEVKLSHTERWNKRWEGFVKANKDVVSVKHFRRLPDGKGIMVCEVADGFETRLYADGKDLTSKIKVLASGLKAESMARAVYADYKHSNYDLPAVGLEAVNGPKDYTATPKAKKETPKKKAAAKSKPKKEAAKKAPEKKETPKKKKAASKKSGDKMDDFWKE